MDVRPVLTAADQVLAGVEARDADLTAALGQIATWDRQGLHVPRVVVGIAAAPDPARIESELSAFGVAGVRLALALAEGDIDAAGMREGLDAVRARTGAVAIVADFGSGAHPDVEFLVDYPADALALSARIVEGVGERREVAARVKETCTVTGGLGWRVIAADVASAEERRALAAAGVAEVAGPGIAPFSAPAELSSLLARLKVTIPAALEPSGRRVDPEPAAAPSPAPSAPQAPTTKAEATATETAKPLHTSRWSRDAEEEKPAPRLARPSDSNEAASKPAATSIGAAIPAKERGSPGRSQPQRGDEGPEDRRPRGPNIFLIILILIILAAIAYAVLAYLGHVPDPLGIEDIEI